ncbi:MAG: alpha/beta fold hydrolase [Spirochaetes bacterium]|nr:alpha/beta fold hydrolase [Spirochaetota bacterium]
MLLSLISCTTDTHYTVGDIKKMRRTNNNYPERNIHVENGAWVTGDIRIHHFIDGVGTPVLIIHGGPGEPYKKPWEGLRHLNGSNQFVYYDQRGCGKSTRPIDRFPAANRHDNREALIRNLGLRENIDDIERI